MSTSKDNNGDLVGHRPWIEVYRPLDLNDVVGNEEVIERLKVVAREGNMPHLILSGPPGTGKTTALHCVGQQLLGSMYKEAVLELNASDERGIQVVRNAIKMFAQKKVTLPKSHHKLIILDEADSMTAEAQQALRRIMENYASTTRFALACNQSSHIIEPIQSRCALLRFTKLSDQQVLKRLLNIADREHVPYTSDGLEALIFTAEGDMRQAINNLQSTYTGFGLVNSEAVFKVCDQPHPYIAKEILLACVDGQIDASYAHLQSLWAQGYSAIDIITTLFKVAKKLSLEDESLRMTFIRHIGLCHLRLVDGVQTLVQLSGLLASLCAASPKLL
jgi:replication factor C subunit 2/4